MAKNTNKDLEPTPLIRQYRAIKAQHPDHVVFFRCGDFYEMFFEDAQLGHKVLGITLTKRGTDEYGKPVPLAGVPFHSVDSYLSKMVHAGYRVAICEQMENPKFAKGVVKREVIRVVTPGTVLEDSLLDDKSNNYLVGLAASDRGEYGLASLDFSTGQFAMAEFRGSRAAEDCKIELNRLQPSEIVVSDEQRDTMMTTFALEGRRFGHEENLIEAAEPAPLTPVSGRVATIGAAYMTFWAARKSLTDLFGVRDLTGFGAQDCTVGVSAAAAVLQFLRETQRGDLHHINELRVYHPGDFMILDETTQRSLELVTNLNDATRHNTLLEVLDRTHTPMGARMLRQWILQPLRDIEKIQARLDAVEVFAGNRRFQRECQEALRGINDIERIVSRCGCKTANARDLVALRESLDCIPTLVILATKHKTALLDRLAAAMDPLDDLREELRCAIVDQPPVSLREGGMIRDGYNAELDELHAVSGDGKSWIAAMRQKEVETTGIQNLKIGYNKVFGYFIEITNSFKDKVPSNYIRKQTLVGAERYITPELKEKEDVILHAEERMQELEYELFDMLRQKVVDVTRQIQQTARAVAEFDVLAALGAVAQAANYCKPVVVTDTQTIEIVKGRHPVIEGLNLDPPFVPNDTKLDRAENQILLITGPNMAGKSTYIRQVALIALMAHIGSFVPATAARLGLLDRIFTRVGAMDKLAHGESTFLVEMTETANILNNATDKSLVILDEIGRGTSTYDGLSIAWAVIEFLHNTPGRTPLTLFATHYHELAKLEGPLSRLKNYNVAVLEDHDAVRFLYEIRRGSTDHSYGIYAAQVAGVPRAAITRAKEILQELEDAGSVKVAAAGEGDSMAPVTEISGRKPSLQENHVQLTLFDLIDDPILLKLRSTDPNNLTPIQALSLIAELVNEAKKI